jgi:hypothetical protein
MCAEVLNPLVLALAKVIATVLTIVTVSMYAEIKNGTVNLDLAPQAMESIMEGVVVVMEATVVARTPQLKHPRFHLTTRTALRIISSPPPFCLPFLLALG